MRIVEPPAALSFSSNFNGIWRRVWTSKVISIKLISRPLQLHLMIRYIIRVGQGIIFVSVGTLSADLRMEICSAVSQFLMTHPQENMNYPEEVVIWIHHPIDQDIHIYCGPGQGSFEPFFVYEKSFAFETLSCFFSFLF